MTNLHKILSAALITIMSATVFSCSSSDGSESVDRDNNCAITRMTLGTLLRTVHTNVNGKDTTYVTTIAGSSYPMSIDQLKQEIFNLDSLPAGTDITRIIFNSVSNDGTVVYETKSGKDTLFSATDSIDFTTPRKFTCYSTDGLHSKTYTVKINVHNSNPDNYTWQTVTTSTPVFEGITSQKMFVINGNIVILAISNGQPIAITAHTTTPQDCASSTISGLITLDPTAVMLYGGKLYYADNDTLKTSTDGISWESLATQSTATISRLVATTNQDAFALSQGGILHSTDMFNWTDDDLADDFTQFPQTDITATHSEMAFNPNFHYVIVCGKTTGGSNIIWRKIIDTKGDNSEPWAIYPMDNDNKYLYPTKAQPLIFTYGDQLLHLGLQDGSASQINVSTDGGRCWKPQSTANNPVLATPVSTFSAFVDPDHNIWIATSPAGQIARGRINRLSYDNTPSVFPKHIIR